MPGWGGVYYIIIINDLIDKWGNGVTNNYKSFNLYRNDLSSLSFTVTYGILIYITGMPYMGVSLGITYG